MPLMPFHHNPTMFTQLYSTPLLRCLRLFASRCHGRTPVSQCTGQSRSNLGRISWKSRLSSVGQNHGRTNWHLHMTALCIRAIVHPKANQEVRKWSWISQYSRLRSGWSLSKRTLQKHDEWVCHPEICPKTKHRLSKVFAASLCTCQDCKHAAGHCPSSTHVSCFKISTVETFSESIQS